MRRESEKGGSPTGSLPRADPADGAGGQAGDPGHDEAKRGEGIPVGVVALEKGSPSGGQAFHTASREAKRDLLLRERPSDLLHSAPATAITLASTPMATRLTDEKWERIKPLMPPQKPPTGRPRSEQRRVLAGMVWVFGTGASWRDLPEEEFGPWRTVYGRYRQWREEGLWQRIVEML